MACPNNYTIVTWNVRGLGTAGKRYKVHSYLTRRKTHIAVLQETHLTKTELERLHKRWRGQLFGTGFSSFSRGVLIWIRPSIPYRVISHRVDDGGRFVYVRGLLDGSPLNILGIYAPNTNQITFLHTLKSS